MGSTNAISGRDPVVKEMPLKYHPGSIPALEVTGGRPRAPALAEGRTSVTTASAAGLIPEHLSLQKIGDTVRRPLRFSIAALMGVVLFTSFYLAALKSGSSEWAGAIFMTTCGVLLLSIVGAVSREGGERTW